MNVIEADPSSPHNHNLNISHTQLNRDPNYLVDLIPRWMVSHAAQQKHAWLEQSTYNHDILLEEQVDSFAHVTYVWQAKDDLDLFPLIQKRVLVQNSYIHTQIHIFLLSLYHY